MSSDLAIRLRQMRVNTGLTQKELADAIGIKSWKIGSIEKGITLPAEKELLDFAFACYDDQSQELLNLWLQEHPPVEEYV